MTNDFIRSREEHTAFTYSCFDRVIIRGYIRNLFCIGGVVRLLRSPGFKTQSSGVLRTLTDQFNGHIEKVCSKEEIPVHSWPGLNLGKNGDKLHKNSKIENSDQLSEMEQAYHTFNDALAIINKEFRRVA